MRSAVERPLRTAPAIASGPVRSRSSTNASWACRSGRSTTPIRTATGEPVRTAGSSAALTVSGSGGSHGLAGVLAPRSAAARRIAPTSIVRSVSPPSPSAPLASCAAGGRPSSVTRRGTALTGWSGSSAPVVRGQPTRAAWNAVSSPCPVRRYARPGCRVEIRAASGASTTSLLSVVLVTRRPIRRLRLARISALTTPPGRWVASTTCTPRLRPRMPMPTTPGTNSGTSSTSEANSSTTMTSRGSRPPVRAQ